jgi:hypothetical protein
VERQSVTVTSDCLLPCRKDSDIKCSCVAGFLEKGALEEEFFTGYIVAYLEILIRDSVSCNTTVN